MFEPAETSYFSSPAAGLDPRLFRDGKLIPSVRSAIMQTLLTHLNAFYTGGDAWAHAWLAGSGVSYQWAAQRDPGDLDCLVGINYPSFRQSNPRYAGFSDAEIAQELNETFRTELYPKTKEFMGSFELTFYVNKKSNILDIKPYSAYSLTDDDWHVTPPTTGPAVNQEWEELVAQDMARATEIITRYVAARKRLDQAANPGVKANIQSEVKVALSQAASLYDQIHSGRRIAFSESGEGYQDFANYRWQAGKRNGVVQALKHLKDTLTGQTKEFEQKTYGAELPDVSVLVRRAASHRIM